MKVTVFPNVTPSRVNDLVCRKRFYEVQVLKVVPHEAFSPALAYGSGIHDALKRLTDPSVRIPSHQRDAETAVRRAFLAQSYPDDETRERDILRAVTTVRAYLAQATDLDAIVGVEVFAEFRPPVNGPRRLAGAKFDALLIRPEEPQTLVVRDYKTGKVKETELESACVAVAVARVRLKQYEQEFGRPLREVVLEYEFLNEEGLAARVRLTEAQVKLAWPDIRARTEQVYAASEFPPEPGEHCTLCPLRPLCRPALTLTADEFDSLFV